MARTSGSGQRHRDVIAWRQDVVERAEAYLRTHADAPVPLPTLCRIVGLSERGLRNAFYSVRGMSPKRCMLAARLQDVRQVLSGAGTRSTTVTDVAMHHGFYELGRFAAAYRKAFGETPSVTLRGTRRTIGSGTQGEHEGHTDACTS